MENISGQNPPPKGPEGNPTDRENTHQETQPGPQEQAATQNTRGTQQPPQVVVCPYASGEQKKSRPWLPILGIGCGCLPVLFAILLLIAVVGMFSGVADDLDTEDDHIALIRITGVIVAGNGSSGGLFESSFCGSEEVVRQLEKARKNDGAQAIILRINSPGGSPAGAEEIYNGIKKVREYHKPVYVSIADVGASAAYWISCAADKIYCNKSSLVGSIGVIFPHTEYSGLYDKLGISEQNIVTGKFKDTGTSGRPLREDEKEYLRKLVYQTFADFKATVEKGRKMSTQEVEKIADGRVFHGSEAKNLKLVDGNGGLQEVISAASDATGLGDDPVIIEYKSDNWFEEIFGAESTVSPWTEKPDNKQIMRKLFEELSSSGTAR